MADVNSVIQRLEGAIGTIANSGFTPATLAGVGTNFSQPALVWLENMKAVMRQPFLRDLTDWELFIDGDIVNASTSGLARTGASTFYGALWGTIEEAHVSVAVVLNTAGLVTYAADAAQPATLLDAVVMPAAASASFREYHGLVRPFGIAAGTGLSFADDGLDGVAPTANDISVIAVYRTA